MEGGREVALRTCIGKAWLRRMPLDTAVERLTVEVKRHVNQPNPTLSYVFWNRTRRYVALIPFAMLSGVSCVHTPFLDHRLFDFLAGLPLELVAKMSDEDIWRLNRGGHDPHKIYAAYAAATKHRGQPTVILAKTVKGYGMGAVGEGKNIAHQQKKMPLEALRQFRDRFAIPIADAELESLPYFKPPADSPEMKYLREVRAKLGGSLPQRRRRSASLDAPKGEAFKPLLEATAEGREISTTMAFVRLLTALVRDKTIGRNIVPIVPDESRTFGMEGLFRQLGIYSSVGQLYEPEDSDQLMFYKEDKNGQILQEGINEAGATCSWIAAATSYSTNNVPMIPFFIFYSMFGLQRVGDLLWAAGDMRARGFLLGGTAGRTTLNGEGLQHEDGHSHILSSMIPNCRSYDPTFAGEVAVIVQDGLKRMVEDQEDVFYYITLMNENYAHPALPAEAREGVLKGMYRLKDGGPAKGPRVQLLGSGTILREVIAAADLLATDWGVTADLWSCPSFNELGRDGQDCERHNLLHPDARPRVPFVAQQLEKHAGPVVASTDYIKSYAEQIRSFLPKGRTYKVLGTDGFGRSDFRSKLREHFEIDRHYIVVAALKALSEEGTVPVAKVSEAIRQYACGTGIGGGLILNGKLYYGAFGYAGEIGQTVLFPGAPLGPTNDRCIS